MAHDVFVSYSIKDKVVADAVVARIEADAIRCWVAPRDVVPGADWGESIINAIESSRIMLLVFSTSANASPQIKREVERAVDKGVYIIPLRLDNIEPTKSLEYFISTSQWLDAFPPPMENHLDFLAKTVKAILAGRPPPLPPAPPSPPSPARSPVLPWAVTAVALLLLLAGGAWFLALRQRPNPEPGPGPSPLTTATVAAPSASPIYSQNETPPASATPATPDRPAIPQIAGMWHDTENSNYGAQISQEGENFTFVRWGILNDGTQFKGSGSGRLTGLQFKSQYRAAWFHPAYQTSSNSSGHCSGSVSADGMHMVLSCNDSLFGYSAGEAYREEN